MIDVSRCCPPGSHCAVVEYIGVRGTESIGYILTQEHCIAYPSTTKKHASACHECMQRKDRYGLFRVPYVVRHVFGANEHSFYLLE
jgi:hypothetical protein